jgi:hypothetical protein
MNVLSIKCSRISEKVVLIRTFPGFPACCPCKSNMQTKMSMEHLRNDSGRRKQMYSEKSLSQCHFVHQKSHME